MSDITEEKRPDLRMALAAVLVIAAIAAIVVAILSTHAFDGDPPQLESGAAQLAGSEPNDRATPSREGEIKQASQSILDMGDVRQQWRELDDPAGEGWDTEAFSAGALAQLNRIGKLLSGTEGSAALGNQDGVRP